MAILARNIKNGVITQQIARLSNGWLVTCYSLNSSDYQFIRSIDGGKTWQDLCRLFHTSGPNTDYVLSMNAILADGANVFVVFGYGDINDNDRVNTVYFTPASVTTTTNLYTMRTAGSIISWFSVTKAKLLYGRYQYLEETLNIGSPNTLYKRHISSNTTASPIPGTAYISGSQNADAQKGDSDIHALADGQEWIFYGSANYLMLRRRLSANATMQTAQTLVTAASNNRISRINVIELKGTHYVFFSWMSIDGSNRGFGYVTTTDGLTFSSLVTLLNNPYSTTSTQAIDFDVLLEGNRVCLLLAIPNGANRILYSGKFQNGALQVKSSGQTVANNNVFYVIRAIASNNREHYFSATLDNGTNVVQVSLDVEGIKMSVNGLWTNIDQAYRYNGTLQQEQNGKQMVNGVWKDIN